MDSTDKDKDLNVMRQEAKIDIPSTSGYKSEPTQPPNLPREELLDEMDPTPNRDFEQHVDMMSSPPLVGMGAKPMIPRLPEPPTKPPKLPRADLLVGMKRALTTCFCNYFEGSREDYINVGAPLYKALRSENWRAVMVILDRRPELVQCAITKNYDTALHFVASAKDTKLKKSFVEDFMNNRIIKEDLELQNKDGDTAFCFAVAAGNVEIAKIMATKNPNVLNIPGSQGLLPLHMGALIGKHDMVKYLYESSKMTCKLSPDKDWGWVLVKCVEAEMFDVAIEILEDRLTLDKITRVSSNVLRVLAETPTAFISTENIIWKMIGKILPFEYKEVELAKNDSDALRLLRLICENIKELHMKEFDDILRGLPHISSNTRYSSKILFTAAEKGNTIFISELIRLYPYLRWERNDNGLTIFHTAVMHRHADIYNLLHQLGPMKQLITQYTDQDDNNMLHLVGKTSNTMRHQTMSGVLLLQRDLLWFDEIEKIVHPDFRKRKNKDGLTPYELFFENNKHLVSQGLKWMKDCMVVATLMVSVACAVAFTVPGGYNQDIGIPTFMRKSDFIVFVIADAISLCFSTASLLVFLSILTSRYGERDFLYSLPRRLMIGLLTLFVSVAAMMATFGASFFVLYRRGLIWLPILITVLPTIPVLIYGKLQSPLLVEMFRSTYDATYLFKPKKHMLDNLNPWL